jgi:hypothetical protein
MDGPVETVTHISRVDGRDVGGEESVVTILSDYKRGLVWIGNWID